MEFTSLPLANDYQLRDKQVDLWHFPLSEPPKNAMRFLNDEEQIRAKRYLFPRHRRRYTAAHASLRVILARYLNTQPHELHFTENQYGKPYLKAPFNTLQFNLSHSQNSALLAIGLDQELGVDLEYFSTRPFLGIADHVFSATEIQALNQAPQALQTSIFFNIWAQKEAFIKAAGLGLSYPLKEFSVPSNLAADSQIIDHLTQTPWRLLSFQLTPRCAAALCINPKITEIRRMAIPKLQDFLT